MKTRFFSILALAAPAVFAQVSVPEALAKHWKVTGDFTIAVAKMMPPDQYAFSPIPEEMSFGQLVVHIAGANLNACANASGMPRPAIPQKISDGVKEQKKDVDKDGAVQFLSDSFEFCNTAVASMTPEQFSEVVELPRVKANRAES